MAVAAATCGLTRWVRPPLPCRPSKLRLDVEALRSPGASLSGFMPRHIEQPGRRHSAPACSNTSPRPSASACSRTWPTPGRRASGRRRPRATLEDARDRPQVLDAAVGARADEDRVDAIARIGVPAVRPMYSSARRAAALSLSSAMCSGSGTHCQGGTLARVGAPRDERRELGGVEDDLGVELASSSVAAGRASGDGSVPVLTLWRMVRPAR
jgi:hypothetical protein